MTISPPRHSAHPSLAVRAEPPSLDEPRAEPEPVVAVPQRTRPLGFHRGSRRAPSPYAYLTAALLRCALYLGPVSVALAGAGLLHRVGWLAAVAVLLLGWTAAQTLTSLGVATVRHAGRPPAARLIGGGFAAVAGLWGAYVWAAPAWLLGPDRWLALTVGLGGVATLATVTAALVTRAEAAVIRWSLPCWLLALVSLAARGGVEWAAQVPVHTLLPAAITVATIRAYRPVIGRALPKRPPLTRAQRRRAAGYFVIGLAQAASVAMLWRSGPPGSAAAVWLPFLVGVPVVEALVGWHTRALTQGLGAAADRDRPRRQDRRISLLTAAGLLPPLAVGAVLAITTRLLPGSGGNTREIILALAAGTLLSGVIAATFVLAERRWIALAATVAALTPATVGTLTLLQEAAEPLPALVAVLGLTYLLGLLAVALTPADPRRSS